MTDGTFAEMAECRPAKRQEKTLAKGRLSQRNFESDWMAFRCV